MLEFKRKKINPTTPSNRFLNYQIKDYVDSSEREKSLVRKQKRSSGRDNKGRITSRCRGGGHKRAYRIINFKWSASDIGSSYTVVSVQYDPNRNVPIALCRLDSAEKDSQKLIYVIRQDGLDVGSSFYVSEKFTESKPGSVMPIGEIPVGIEVSCVELKPMKGAQIARSAGSYVKIAGFDGDFAIINLPSGEQRKISKKSLATIGRVSGQDYLNRSEGKAGRRRWLGRRSHVRGVAMNPVDHPHGGGEGKTSGGRHPTTPWGKTNKGTKTRVNKRTSRFIISGRKK